MKAMIRKDAVPDSAKISELHREGSLDRLSSRALLTELNRQNWSGMIELRAGERLKRLWMKRGRIGRLQSNLRSELFGHFLENIKNIAPESIAEGLKLQAEKFPQKKLGEILRSELSQSRHISTLLDADLKTLERLQFVSSFIQALTWKSGTFTLSPEKAVTMADSEMIEIDVIPALVSLFDLQNHSALPVFSELPLWLDSSGPLHLGRTPLWNILASAKLRGLSGVLILRKENHLYELVIKQGLPMIYYEGTFAKPRQLIIVRQEGCEHEEFFIDQIFHLMSFTTGSAFFRLFDRDNEISSALEPVESTAVMPEEEMKKSESRDSDEPSRAWAHKLRRLFAWRS